MFNRRSAQTESLGEKRGLLWRPNVHRKSFSTSRFQSMYNGFIGIRLRIFLILFAIFCLIFVQVKDNKILDSLKMQNQALRLKEEEEKLAKKSLQAQFSERLLNPTAGSRNLLRCLETSKGSKESKGISSPTAPVKSITAKDLLLQHQQKLLEMKAIQMKASKVASSSPQLGRGLVQDQKDIDLSEEVFD